MMLDTWIIVLLSHRLRYLEAIMGITISSMESDMRYTSNYLRKALGREEIK